MALPDEEVNLGKRIPFADKKLVILNKRADQLPPRHTGGMVICKGAKCPLLGVDSYFRASQKKGGWGDLLSVQSFKNVCLESKRFAKMLRNIIFLSKDSGMNEELKRVISRN